MNHTFLKTLGIKQEEVSEYYFKHGFTIFIDPSYNLEFYIFMLCAENNIPTEKDYITIKLVDRQGFKIPARLSI